MGARWALYDPVLPDALGFFLLMLLVIACLQRRYLLFAVALVAGVLTREHLLMTVPFMWRAHLPGRVVRFTLLTLIVSAPAAITLPVRSAIASIELHTSAIASRPTSGTIIGGCGAMPAKTNELLLFIE